MHEMSGYQKQVLVALLRREGNGGPTHWEPSQGPLVGSLGKTRGVIGSLMGRRGLIEGLSLPGKGTAGAGFGLSTEGRWWAERIEASSEVPAEDGLDRYALRDVGAGPHPDREDLFAVWWRTAEASHRTFVKHADRSAIGRVRRLHGEGVWRSEPDRDERLREAFEAVLREVDARGLLEGSEQRRGEAARRSREERAVEALRRRAFDLRKALRDVVQGLERGDASKAVLRAVGLLGEIDGREREILSDETDD